MSNLTYFQNPVYLHHFCLFEIFVRPAKKRMKRSLFHIPNGYAHICSPTGTCHGPWNSRVVSIVWPLLASQSSTRRLAMDISCYCRLSLNYTYLTCRNFVYQHSVMVETTLKPRAFACLSCIISNMYWETRCYFKHPRKHQANVISGHAGIPPDCVHLAEKLALVAFRLFPRPLWFHAAECCGASLCRFKSVPTWLGDCADRFAHARDASLQPEYSCCYRVRYRCLAVKSMWY